MRESGYIKLHRSMLEWEWYRDANTKALFLHCLLKANWEAGRFQGVEVPRGSFVTSLSKLALETGLTVKQIRTALNHLKATNEVASRTTSKFSVITIKNYDKYQTEGKQEGTQGASEGQAKGNNIRNKELKNTNTNPLTPLPTARGDEVEAEPKKKESKKNQTTTTDLKKLVDARTYSNELKDELKNWLDYRKEIGKPFKTEKGFTELLNKVDYHLEEYTESQIIDLIRECESNGWQGIIFKAIKGGNSGGRRKNQGNNRQSAGSGQEEPTPGTYEWYKLHGVV